MSKLSLKDSLMASKILMPMDIQLFSDPPAGTGTDPIGGCDPNPSDPPAETEGKKTEKTFTQAQLAAAAKAQADAARTEEAARLNAEHQAALKKAREEGRTEAEKMANMTADQKAEAEAQAKLDEFAKREAEITRRELRSQTLETLAEKGLDNRLSGILTYENAEHVSDSIALLEKVIPEVIREGIEKGIKDRLAGNSHLPGGGSGGSAENKAGKTGERLAKQSIETEPKKNPYFKENN